MKSIHVFYLFLLGAMLHSVAFFSKKGQKKIFVGGHLWEILCLRSTIQPITNVFNVQVLQKAWLL